MSRLDEVTVVIVTHNSAGTLARVLTPLVGRLPVVVVDSASTDASPAIAEAFDGVTVVRSELNLGFGRASNRGADATRGKYLLTLNPDCIASPEAIDLLAARLEADPGLGFAGPQIRKQSGELDRACLRGDPDPVGALLYVSRVSSLFPGSALLNRYNLTHADYEADQPLLNGTGACLLFRTDAYRAVGGFDERFFMYGEDLDLCRVLREAGHPGAYVAAAKVTHIKGESTRQRSGEMLVEFHRAMWLYYLKHEAPRRAAPVNAGVAVGITALGVSRLAANALRREKWVSAR